MQRACFHGNRLRVPRTSKHSRTFSNSTRSFVTSHELKDTSKTDGPPISQTNRAEKSLKRFWKSVEVAPSSGKSDASWVIKLDKRALKTPDGQVLELPHSKRLAANVVALEWDLQDKLMRHHSLPMTSLVSRAIDGLRKPSTATAVREDVLRYLDTDTICYPEQKPPALVRLQEQYWDPILSLVQETYGVKFEPITSFFGRGQPPATKRILSSVIEDFDEWELAALERAVYSTKSFITAFALVKGHIKVEEAARVAQVEVLAQTEAWGEVEDTHDVDHRDIRRQLGSAASLLVDH